MDWRLVLVVGALALIIVGVVFIVVERDESTASQALPAIETAEHARTIEAMHPPKRARPLIAIVTLSAATNGATEISDFLSVHGVLARADVADIVVVAEKGVPVRLEPLTMAPVQLYSTALWLEPQMTMSAFEEAHPDGADFVVVPAIEPRGDRAVVGWIAEQRRKGANIVSVCNGALTLAAAGLLDRHRATAHWSGLGQLREKHPSMQWVPDRRYVADDGVMTSTGITGALPAMVALVEGIAGQAKAAAVATELGLDPWDERHRSALFQLTGAHKATFVRNLLTLWRHDTVSVPVRDGIDEVALGLTVDAYARTGMTRVQTVGAGNDWIRSRQGLRLRPEMAASQSKADLTLPPPSAEAPAQAVEGALAAIAARYDRATARLVALTIEYPWAGTARATPN